MGVWTSFTDKSVRTKRIYETLPCRPRQCCTPRKGCSQPLWLIFTMFVDVETTMRKGVRVKFIMLIFYGIIRKLLEVFQLDVSMILTYQRDAHFEK